MKKAQNLFEIEALTENLMKKESENGLLKMKVLTFVSLYENLSVGMIIEKLGIKKSNFALLTAELENEGLIISKQAEIDRRCRTLSLTEKGKSELDDYLSRVEERIGETDIEVDKAIETLIKFLNKRI